MNHQLSPPVTSLYEEVFAECYQYDKELASDETRLLSAFPGESPFTLEDTLNPDYLPD